MNSDHRLLVRLNSKVRRKMRGFDLSSSVSSTRRALLTVSILGIACIVAFMHPLYKANLSPPHPFRSIILTMPDGDSIDLTAASGRSFQAKHAIIKADSGSVAIKTASAIPELEWNTLEVPEGEFYSIELGDSTEVKLNSASSLQFPFSFASNRREVYLDGEAFFSIPRQSSFFIIHTPDGDIKTSGGELNIETYDSTFIVSVFKDSAWIHFAGQEVVLLPGQSATRDKSGKGLTVGLFELETILSRLQGKYVFAGESLDNVSKVIERWYATRVVIDEKEMVDRPYYGVIYKDQSLDFFLQDLQKTDNIASYFDDAGKLHLK